MGATRPRADASAIRRPSARHIAHVAAAMRRRTPKRVGRFLCVRQRGVERDADCRILRPSITADGRRRRSRSGRLREARGASPRRRPTSCASRPTRNDNDTCRRRTGLAASSVDRSLRQRGRATWRLGRHRHTPAASWIWKRPRSRDRGGRRPAPCAEVHRSGERSAAREPPRAGLHLAVAGAATGLEQRARATAASTPRSLKPCLLPPRPSTPTCPTHTQSSGSPRGSPCRGPLAGA